MTATFIAAFTLMSTGFMADQTGTDSFGLAENPYTLVLNCPPETPGSRDLVKHLLFGPTGNSVRQELGLTGISESDVQLMVAFNTLTAMACGIITDDNQAEIGAQWQDGSPVFYFTIFRVQNRYFAVHKPRDPFDIVDGVARIRKTRSLISVYDGNYNRIKGYSL